MALGLALLPLGWLVALKCLGLMPKLPIGWLRSLAVQVRWPSWPGACLEGCCRLGRCLSFERFLPLGVQGVLRGLRLSLGCRCCWARLLGLLCCLLWCLLRFWLCW